MSNMSNSKATHTIVYQSPVFAIDGPVRSITTEVIKTADSTWTFNITNYHFGRLFSKECKGAFNNKNEAEAARQAFIAEQLKTAEVDFYIE